MHTLKMMTTKFNDTLIKDCFPSIFQENPAGEIYKNFVGEKLPENKLFVVLGTDSGLLIDYLLQLATPGQRFVVLEQGDVIDWIKQTKTLNSKIELYSFEDFQFEMLYEQYQDYVIRNAIILLKSLVVEQEVGAYKDIFRRYEEQFHRFRIDRVDNRNFKKTFDQQLANVCDLMHPLHVIKDRLKGDVPAIILGGGPSLDDVIPWLKINQHKIWIFAASRICKRLLKEGITPDFIASLDPQPLIFEYSKEMYQFTDSSILITGEHPYPELIRQWKGLKTYTRRRFPWARRSEENFISDGPTVTNAMFGMAVYLGVSKLYLAGVDFCFTLDGVCHESGSIESTMGIRDHNDTHAINYRGEKVGTNIQLYDARNLFEEQLANLSKTWTDIESFNLNSGAAVIEGIDYQPKESIALEAEKFNVVEAFDAELNYDVVSQKAFLDFLSQEFNHTEKWLEKIAQKAKKGLHLTSVLFDDTKKQSKRIKDVLKLKTQLESYVGVDYQTMVNYAYTDFMQSLEPVDSEENMSHQEMTNALTGFFKGLQQGATGFLERIQMLREDLAFRELEIDEQTTFPQLASEWLQRNIPGRFYVWLEHFKMCSYDECLLKYPNEVERLESEFKKRLGDESRLKHKFEDRLSDPQEYIIQLIKSFDQTLLHSIEKSIRQLKSLPKKEFQPIQYFAEGLLLELQNRQDEAYEKYLQADPDKIKPYVLQRLFPIAFSKQQYEFGLSLLETLCQQEIKFLPIFADALALLGNVKGAIEAYQAYPLLKQDTHAVINLLKLYVQSGMIEAANQLLVEIENAPKLDQALLQEYVDSLNATA